MSSVEVSEAGTAPAQVPRADLPLRPRRGAFRRLWLSEVRLLLRRRRNLALLAALAVVPLVIGVAVRLSRPDGSEGPAFLGQISENGVFLVLTALTVCLPLFLPLVVGVVAGDSIAGEAGTGTLRYLLTVPVTRGRLLAAKSLGVLFFVALAVLVVALVGLVAGALLFGLGDVTLISGDVVGLGPGLLRTLGVAAYVVVALAGLAAGGLFVSTLTENAIAAMATTISLAVLSAVLDAVPQLRPVHTYLLTDHWLGFGELLRAQVDTGALLRWSALHLAYVAIFLSLAWARLTTKDITS